jgi:hypothetical protein
MVAAMSLYWVTERKRWRIKIEGNTSEGRVRKTKILPAGTSEEEARVIHDKMSVDLLVRQPLIVAQDGWQEFVAGMMADKTSWIYKTLAKVKMRNKAKHREAPLTANDLQDLLLHSKGRCAVTGIRFQMKMVGRYRPFYPSLDRIDSSRGYVHGNMRIVCYAVNVAMLHWGEDVFAEVATGYVFNRYCAIGLVSKMNSYMTIIWTQNFPSFRKSLIYW